MEIGCGEIMLHMLTCCTYTLLTVCRKNHSSCYWFSNGDEQEIIISPWLKLIITIYNYAVLHKATRLWSSSMLWFLIDWGWLPDWLAYVDVESKYRSIELLNWNSVSAAAWSDWEDVASLQLIHFDTIIIECLSLVATIANEIGQCC